MNNREGNGTGVEKKQPPDESFPQLSTEFSTTDEAVLETIRGGLLYFPNTSLTARELEGLAIAALGRST